MALQLGFYIIPGRCVQCQACKVACKNTNDVELGPQWRTVAEDWSGQFPTPRNLTMSYACMHCEKPACVDVCPVKAISKRASDGIVVVNQEKCIGCRSCEKACPYGAPQYGKSGKMQKCDFCASRLGQGKQPACVATCPGEALGFGSLDDLKKLDANGTLRLAGATDPAFFIVPSKLGPPPQEYVKTFFRKA
jgi:anaerobic dimethyl sulfoxide reductase subunit B (iron-sulfur subunit)